MDNPSSEISLVEILWDKNIFKFHFPPLTITKDLHILCLTLTNLCSAYKMDLADPRLSEVFHLSRDPDRANCRKFP